MAPLKITALVPVNDLKHPEFPITMFTPVVLSTVATMVMEFASPSVYEQLITSVVEAPTRSCAASVIRFVSRKPYGMTPPVRLLTRDRFLDPSELVARMSEMTECSPARVAPVCMCIKTLLLLMMALVNMLLFMSCLMVSGLLARAVRPITVSFRLIILLT